tara:strand:+ start:260 stop:796 length:537 start_codon:yes stop_codon:yes gene_type:complete
MKKALIYFTIIVGVAAIIGGCKSSDDGAATTDTSTCTGTSSGSGPTIGSVTLEEAAYLSSCFGGTKIKLEFKNNSSAQKTHYSSYSGDSCAGTASTEITSCIESITVSSTTVTKPTYLEGSLGDNVTGYDTTGLSKNSSMIRYMNFSADNASVFYYNQSSTQAKLDSNAYYFWKFTKQ